MWASLTLIGLFLWCYDLHPSVEQVCNWLSLVGTVLALATPQVPMMDGMPLEEEEKEKESESESESEKEKEKEKEKEDAGTESENSSPLSYWEQVYYNAIGQSNEAPVPELYYSGEYPTTWANYGPLVASAEGKVLLDSVIQTDLQWYRVPRINRFTIFDENFERQESLKCIPTNDQVDPHLALIVAEWYRVPWFISKRELDLVCNELTFACPGLRHLQFNRQDAEDGQHYHAPPTLIISVPTFSTSTNWRQMELLCGKVFDGWYCIRAIEVRHPGDKELGREEREEREESEKKEKDEIGRIYFYASLFVRDRLLWTKYESDRLNQWGQDVMKLIRLKYVGMPKNAPRIEDPAMILSNQWMMLRLPE